MATSSRSDRKLTVKIDSELAGLIPAFIENRAVDIRIMTRAVETGDYAAVERIGHGMKGAGAGFGFDLVTEIGASIEKAAKAKDIPGMQQGIAALSEYMARVEVVYE
jgi:histidine phosphotransfer protein HptB